MGREPVRGQKAPLFSLERGVKTAFRFVFQRGDGSRASEIRGPGRLAPRWG